MDFEMLVRKKATRSAEWVIVRPGISLCLFYAEPLASLATHIAGILEAYLSFVPPNSIQTYLATDGNWKTLSKGTLTSTLKALRSMKRTSEFWEVHFGQEPAGNVGSYGAHFVGSNLANAVWPLETNLLLLEFPHDFLQQVRSEDFLKFVQNVGSICPFDSGLTGYAFKHLLRTFRRETFEAISQMAMRYIGFDISYDLIRERSRGSVYNVSWLTLLGSHLLERAGGGDAIRKSLPKGASLLDVGSGVLIRAAELPPVGDVNRGADDIEPLRALAKLTQKVRVKVENLGSHDPHFAQRWLNRFE